MIEKKRSDFVNRAKVILFPLSYLLIYFVATKLLHLSSSIAFLVLLVYTGILMFIFRTTVFTLMGNFTHHKDVHKAIKYYDKAVKYNSTIPRTYINHAVLSLRIGDYETALAMLDKAKELSNTITEKKNTDLTLASAYWMSGNRAKAIEAIENMRSTYEYLNPETLATLSYLYYMEDEFEKAKELGDEALKENEKLPLVWEVKGLMYVDTHKDQEAIKAFEMAISLDPRSVDSLYHLSRLYEDTHIEKAYDYILRAKEVNITALHSVEKEEVEEQFLHLQEKRMREAEKQRETHLNFDEDEDEAEDSTYDGMDE